MRYGTFTVRLQLVDPSLVATRGAVDSPSDRSGIAARAPGTTYERHKNGHDPGMTSLGGHLRPRSGGPSVSERDGLDAPDSPPGS